MCISATFYFLSLFYCLVFSTVIRVTGKDSYVQYKERINIKTIQIIFGHYFHWNYIFNIRYWWLDIHGTFHNQKSLLWSNPNLQIFFFFFFNNWFLSILVLKSGDIELDPESSKTSPSYFSCCHWSVNSLPADNYIEVAGLKVYHSIYKYYFICVRESFPN